MKKNKQVEENLFQVIGDDPRLADAVEVEKTIDTDIEKLFTVVGTPPGPAPFLCPHCRA